MTEESEKLNTASRMQLGTNEQAPKMGETEPVSEHEEEVGSSAIDSIQDEIGPLTKLQSTD